MLHIVEVSQQQQQVKPHVIKTNSKIKAQISMFAVGGSRHVHFELQAGRNKNIFEKITFLSAKFIPF